MSVNGSPANIDVPISLGGGTLLVTSAGDFTFTPGESYNALATGQSVVEQFSYEVRDASGLRDTATASIRVSGENDAPNANDDGPIVVDQNGARTIDVLANDSDPENQALRISSFEQGTEGTVTLVNEVLVYTPNSGFVGDDSFTYTVEDAQGASSTATVVVSVQAVNTAPDPTSDTFDLVSNSSQVLDVLANDGAGAGGALDILDFVQPSHGVLTLNPDNTLTYEPNSDYTGPDSFTYRVTDGVNPPVAATVTLQIAAEIENSAPVARDDRFQVQEDGELIVETAEGVLGNDQDDTGISSLTVLRGVQNGSLVLNQDGSFTYQPNADFNGQDSFIYAVSDEGGLRDTATVRISVGAVNDAPVARDDTTQTFEGRSVSGNVISVPEDLNPETDPLSDTDVDLGDSPRVTEVNGAELTGGSIVLSSGALVTMNADGNFEYDPNGAFTLAAGTTGTDSFTYTIEDEGGLTDTATVSVTIRANEDAPDLIALPQTFAGGQTDTQAQISYRVENSGSVAASGPWVDRIYLSLDQTLDASDELLREVSYTGELAAGSFYERTVTVLRTPELAGDYYVLVDVDAQNDVLESDESNIGVSNATGFLSAAFSSTLEVSSITATVGSSVTLSGTAGPEGAFEFVLVEAVNEDGETQSANVLTDGEGDWSIDLPVTAGSAGLLEVNARHPGNPNEDAGPEAVIQIFGMGFVGAPQTVEVIYGDTLSLDLVIENFGSLDLSGLTASLSNLPSDWTGDVTLTETSLDGDGTLIATLEVTLPDMTGPDFEILNIQIDSAEGAVARTQVAIDPVASFADITVDLDDGIQDGPDTQLEAWMLRGEQEIVSFTITNEGSTASAPITVILPDLDWMGLVSPDVIQSLAPGESTDITLSLMPDAELPLAEYSGNLIVSEAGGDVESVEFSFTAVEDDTGSLTLTMTDELFYFADGSPTVDDTRVEVTNALTGEVVFNSKDVDGTVTIDDLPEGYYNIRVNADDHDSFASTLYVNAGQDVEQEAFMSRQSVKYYWSVEEIEIEDRYEVSVEAQFETDVPEPVVVIDPPVFDLSELDQTGETAVFEITVTNHGLIAVENLDIGFDDHPLYDIEFSQDALSALDAKSSITIPVTVTLRETLEEYTERYNDFFGNEAGGLPEQSETTPLESDFEPLTSAPTEPDQNSPIDPLSAPGLPEPMVSPAAIQCQTGGFLAFSYPCGPNDVYKIAPLEMINASGNCEPVGLGGPSSGIGGGSFGTWSGFSSGSRGPGGTPGLRNDGEEGEPSNFVYSPPSFNWNLDTCENIELLSDLLGAGGPRFLPYKIILDALAFGDFDPLLGALPDAIEDIFDPDFEPDFLDDGLGDLDRLNSGLDAFDKILKGLGLEDARELLSDARDFAQPLQDLAEFAESAEDFKDFWDALRNPGDLDFGELVDLGDDFAEAWDRLGLGDFLNGGNSGDNGSPQNQPQTQNSPSSGEGSENDPKNTTTPAGLSAEPVQQPNSVPDAGNLSPTDNDGGVGQPAARASTNEMSVVEQLVSLGLGAYFAEVEYATYALGSVEWYDLKYQYSIDGWLSDLADAQAAASEAGSRISSGEMASLLQRWSDDPTLFLAEQAIERWNNSVEIWTGATNASDISDGNYIDLGEWRDLGLTLATYETIAGQLGLTREQFIQTVVGLAEVEGHAAAEDGVCASVRIQVSQDAVMTRQAFEATLEVVNDADQPIENLFLEIIVYDQDGNLVEENAFGIDDPILSGLTGVDGTGLIEAGATGSAVFTVIPSRLAATDEATTYYVSGNFGYTQDGNQITIPLSREEISVRPQAELELDYFLQRDVLGDDPFTDDFDPTTTDDIEESVPATLAVMVSNVGGGDANNLRIVSAQPEIIENEKGLLVDFEIIGSEINGQPAQPTLEADFGTVAAGDREVATWLLESTLQGKFVDYEVAFQHLNDLGIPELSLITEARIHELIQTVDADGDDLPDFLVNDSGDALGIPDRIYTTAGDIFEVGLGLAAASTVLPSAGGTTEVTAQMGEGWTYISLLEPSDANFEIVQITRDIDGDGDQDVLDIDNWWVTDRTFPAEGRPTYENVLHILDDSIAGELVYTVTYGDEITPNIAPTATDDAATTTAGSGIEISVLENDEDPDAGTLGISGFSQASNGIVTYAAGGVVLSSSASGYDGGLLYTPDEGFVGNDAFTYSITDNQGGVSTATVSVVVDPENQAPVIDGLGPFSVAENTTDVGYVTATDAEGSALNYSIVGGDDDDLFDIDGLTGELSFKSAPDFETPEDSDGDNEYEVQVEVSDGDLTDDAFIFVNVTDVEEDTGPELVTGGTGGQVTGSDADEIIQPNAGTMKTAIGGGGADVFDFSDTVHNGAREFRTILDYIVGEDMIELGDGSVIHHVAQADRVLLFTDQDFDVITVVGVYALDDIQFI